MNKLRVAIIGTGMICNCAHLPALDILRKEGLVEVVGLADIRLHAAKETAERWNVEKYYEDPQQMLDELHPDFVAVCTPNVSHKEWTIKALKAGAHVACEKPLATNVADAKEMWQTSRDCGKTLFPCQAMRWRHYMQESKKLVETGELGDIYFSDLEFIRRIGYPTWGYFHMKEHNYGGPFCDIGVHLIDCLLWICGDKKIESVSGSAFTKIANQKQDILISLAESGAYGGEFTPRPYNPDEYDVEDFATGFIRLEGGMSVNFKFAWAINLPTTNLDMVICGDKAGLHVNKEKLYKNIGRYQAECEMKWFDNGPYKGANFEQHRYMYRNIINTLNGTEEYLVKEHQNLEVIKAIECFYKSAEEHREVKVSEIC